MVESTTPQASTGNGNVTALAVLQFVWAPVGLLAGLGYLFGGALLGAIGSSTNNPFGWMGAAAGIFLMVWGVLYLVLVAAAITAGINLLKYRPLGRTLTFVTAGFAGLDALFTIITIVLGNVFGIVGMIMPAGFAIYAFVMLTRPHIVALFNGGDNQQQTAVTDAA